MTGSSARRLARPDACRAALRAWRALRHPLWTTGTVVRGWLAAPAPGDRTASADPRLPAALPLRLSAPVRRWTDGRRFDGDPLDRRRSTCAIAPARRCCATHRQASSTGRRCRPARASCATARSRRWSGRSVRPRSSSRSSSRSPAKAGAVRQPAHRSRVALDRSPLAHGRDSPARDRPSRPSTRPSRCRPRSPRELTRGMPGRSSASRGSSGRGPRPRSSTRSRPSPGASAPMACGKSLELLRVTGITSHDAYPRWVARHTRKAEELASPRRRGAALPHQPLISIVTPVYNTEPKLAAGLHRLGAGGRSTRTGSTACATTRRRCRRRSRRCVSTRRIRGSGSATRPSTAGSRSHRTPRWSRRQGSSSRCSITTTSCRPTRWRRWCGISTAHPDADVLYSDEDKLDLAGARCDPYFKPDWSPDHFLTCMYTCHFMVIRRSAAGRDRRVPQRL